MVFGLGRKKATPAPDADAPQMSAAAMDMLQQAATGGQPANPAMAPTMAPAMAPSMATGAESAAAPASGMAAPVPQPVTGALAPAMPTPDTATPSGKPKKATREEKKAAAAARKELKLQEKRRKKGSKTRFSRTRYLREANGNAAAGLTLSALLLLITIIGPMLLNFSVLIPQTRENKEIVIQVEQYNDILARAQPLLQAAINNKNQREQAIQGRLGAFRDAAAVTNQLGQFVNDLEAAGAQIIDETSRTVVNTNLGVSGLAGKTVTLKIQSDFLRYLMVRNKFMRNQQSVSVSNEKVAATEGNPIVDIEITVVVPARTES